MIFYRSIRKLFDRTAREAQDYAHAITTLAFQYDLKPSVARERFAAYCKYQNAGWKDALWYAQHSVWGIRWMQGGGE